MGHMWTISLLVDKMAQWTVSSYQRTREEVISRARLSGVQHLIQVGTDPENNQKAFELSCEIHAVSKSFPKEETFGVTSQIRKSSKSVCANIGEGYRKRAYPAHFRSKMSDADMENTETQVWCDFAFACDYIDESKYKELIGISEEIGKMLNKMNAQAEKFAPKETVSSKQ